MSKNNDTMKISDTVRMDAGDTVRIDETVKLSGKTEKAAGSVIRSGFSGGVAVGHTKGNLYKFNNKEYRLIKKISDSTSEAQIFLIEKGKRRYVLKYYYPFIKPKTDLIEKVCRFKHPDIIDVVEYGYFEERFFEIIEYADQGSLADCLPMKDVAKIKKYVGEINEAIHHCHENGIIHRDIKPANIFLRDKQKSDVLLGDFGIASLIDQGEQFRRTNLFQTPIYAAPEYRMNLHGETFITKAVDYYALGITVWQIWSGDVPPGGMDDLEFLRLMFDGNPPLPKNMNDEIAHFVKGLTQRDHKNRWGYNEVIQWLKGKHVEIITENEVPVQCNQFEFGNDKEGKRLFASSPAQLAKLINDYPETGRKHLYRGSVKEWLKNEGYKKLYIEIADITEYKFKDNEPVGTSYAVYILDANFPFIGVDGKECRSKKEIISNLDGNILAYQDLLTDSYTKFYLYLLSKNAVDEVEKYRSYFERYDKELAIYYVIYDLRFSVEKNVPYYYGKEGGAINFKSVKDLADYIFHHPGEASSMMKKNKFSVWLNFMNANVYHNFKKAVKKYTLKSEILPKLLPYILDPERGYEGLSGNMCYNAYDLGKEFDDHFHDYKDILKNDDAPVYTFLKMKGYTGEVEYCKEVFNMKDAAWRDSPYNDNVALMKIIRGFGWTPVMYIHKLENGKRTGKIANQKPEDLYTNRKEIKNGLEKELNNPDSVTIAWLSIFFHEYPINDEDTMLMYGREDFDERLIKFIQFFEEYFPDTEIAKRYKKGEAKAQKIKTQFLSSGVLNKLIYFCGLLFPFSAALMLLSYSYFSPGNYLPAAVWSISGWYFVVFAVATIIYLFSLDDDELTGSTSIVGGGILGLILAVVVYYLFYFIIGSPILLLLLLGIGAYLYYSLFRDVYNALESYQAEESMIGNAEEIDNLIIQYTFNKIDKISFGQSEDLNELKKEIRYKYVFLFGYTAAVTIILLGVLYLLLFYDPNFLNG